jgi:hypothetical protein
MHIRVYTSTSTCVRALLTRPHLADGAQLTHRVVDVWAGRGQPDDHRKEAVTVWADRAEPRWPSNALVLSLPGWLVAVDNGWRLYRLYAVEAPACVSVVDWEACLARQAIVAPRRLWMILTAIITGFLCGMAAPWMSATGAPTWPRAFSSSDEHASPGVVAITSIALETSAHAAESFRLYHFVGIDSFSTLAWRLWMGFGALLRATSTAVALNVDAPFAGIGHVLSLALISFVLPWILCSHGATYRARTKSLKATLAKIAGTGRRASESRKLCCAWAYAKQRDSYAPDSARSEPVVRHPPPAPPVAVKIVTKVAGPALHATKVSPFGVGRAFDGETDSAIDMTDDGQWAIRRDQEDAAMSGGDMSSTQPRVIKSALRSSSPEQPPSRLRGSGERRGPSPQATTVVAFDRESPMLGPPLAETPPPVTASTLVSDHPVALGNGAPLLSPPNTTSSKMVLGLGRANPPTLAVLRVGDAGLDSSSGSLGRANPPTLAGLRVGDAGLDSSSGSLGMKPLVSADIGSSSGSQLTGTDSSHQTGKQGMAPPPPARNRRHSLPLLGARPPLFSHSVSTASTASDQPKESDLKPMQSLPARNVKSRRASLDTARRKSRRRSHGGLRALSRRISNKANITPEDVAVDRSAVRRHRRLSQTSIVPGSNMSDSDSVRGSQTTRNRRGSATMLVRLARIERRVVHLVHTADAESAPSHVVASEEEAFGLMPLALAWGCCGSSVLPQEFELGSLTGEVDEAVAHVSSPAPRKKRTPKGAKVSASSSSQVSPTGGLLVETSQRFTDSVNSVQPLGATTTSSRDDDGKVMGVVATSESSDQVFDSGVLQGSENDSDDDSEEDTDDEEDDGLILARSWISRCFMFMRTCDPMPCVTSTCRPWLVGNGRQTTPSTACLRRRTPLCPPPAMVVMALFSVCMGLSRRLFEQTLNVLLEEWMAGQQLTPYVALLWYLLGFGVPLLFVFWDGCRRDSARRRLDPGTVFLVVWLMENLPVDAAESVRVALTTVGDNSIGRFTVLQTCVIVSAVIVIAFERAAPAISPSDGERQPFLFGTDLFATLFVTLISAQGLDFASPEFAATLAVRMFGLIIIDSQLWVDFFRCVRKGRCWIRYNTSRAGWLAAQRAERVILVEQLAVVSAASYLAGSVFVVAIGVPVPDTPLLRTLLSATDLTRRIVAFVIIFVATICVVPIVRYIVLSKLARSRLRRGMLSVLGVVATQGKARLKRRLEKQHPFLDKGDEATSPTAAGKGAKPQRNTCNHTLRGIWRMINLCRGSNRTVSDHWKQFRSEYLVVVVYAVVWASYGALVSLHNSDDV